jgi:hypothetical protein
MVIDEHCEKSYQECLVLIQEVGKQQKELILENKQLKEENAKLRTKFNTK